MDYKEKYEQALERAKYYHDRDNIQFLENIFPELKESEDEKIRKALIELVKQSAEILNKKNQESMLAWLEKQGEQKSADKVEPKFKNGQWIVWQDKCYKVNYNGCGYELVDQNGLSTSLEYGTIDENAHIWDITKDAKDGDVLAINNDVFIYAHRKQMYSIAVAYCFVDSAGGFYLDGEFGYTEKGNLIHPATKEQRDTLMKVMANAGYTFDFEKKDLKKIEQKSVELPKGENYGIDDLYAAIDILKKTLGKVDGYQTDDGILEHKCAISAVKSLYEQKNSWSEEDEKTINNICHIIRQYDKISKKENQPCWYIGDCLLWMQNIKKKVIPQPRQELSEEEIEKAAQEWDSKANFNPFYMIMDGDKPTDVKQDITTHKESFKAGVNWILKSLRPQSQWKPSEGQLKALKEACDKRWESDGLDPLYTLWKQLKKLRKE